MDDTDEMGIKRLTVAMELGKCEDLDLLDLIYKLLIHDRQERRSH